MVKNVRSRAQSRRQWVNVIQRRRARDFAQYSERGQGNLGYRSLIWGVRADTIYSQLGHRPAAATRQIRPLEIKMATDTSPGAASYEEVKERCLSSGSLFVDEDFPVHDRSIFYNRDVPSYVKWCRPHVR